MTKRSIQPEPSPHGPEQRGSEIEQIRSNYADILNRGSYGDASSLCEQLGERADRLRDRIGKLRTRLEDARAVYTDVWRLAQKFGESSKIEYSRDRGVTSTVKGTVEWVEMPDQTALHFFPPGGLSRYPLLRVADSRTWSEALEIAVGTVKDLETKEAKAFGEMEDLMNRELTLRDLMTEFEAYGAIRSTAGPISAVEAEAHPTKPESASAHYDTRHPFAPYKTWIRDAYKSVRSDCKSNHAAYRAVIAAFDERFGDEVRRKYGRERMISISTVRRVLGDL